VCGRIYGSSYRSWSHAPPSLLHNHPKEQNRLSTGWIEGAEPSDYHRNDCVLRGGDMYEIEILWRLWVAAHSRRPHADSERILLHASLRHKMFHSYISENGRSYLLKSAETRGSAVTYTVTTLCANRWLAEEWSIVNNFQRSRWRREMFGVRWIYDG